MDGHLPPAGLTGQGVGEAAALWIGNGERTGVWQILVGFQGGILSHGSQICLAVDRDGHGGGRGDPVFVDGQVGNGGLPILLCAKRLEGHLFHLLRSQNIAAAQHPSAQHHGAKICVGKLGDANAHQGLTLVKVLHTETVFAVTVHLCRYGTGNQPQHHGADQKKGKKTLHEMSSLYWYTGILCRPMEKYTAMGEKFDPPLFG